MSRSVWMTFVLAAYVATGTLSRAQDNSYISSTNGFWDESRLWSLAEPPSIDQSGIFITNDVSKTVTIDSITASSFADTLTISNLTVSAPAGATNTLCLSNIGTTALHILNGLTIGLAPSGIGIVLVSNSTLVVDEISGDPIEDDGLMGISDSASLIATSCTLRVAAQDSSLFGDLSISNAIVQARDVVIGNNSAHGTSASTELVGGTMNLSEGLAISAVGYYSQASFLVANGGMLTVTNGPICLATGSYCAGNLTVSNATLLAGDVWAACGYRSNGALSINDGTVTLIGALNLGGAMSFGNVSMSGGLLLVTNADTTIGYFDHDGGSIGISDGLFVTRNLFIASAGSYESGFVSISGGTVQVNSDVILGSGHNYNAGDRILLSGGQLIVTNGTVSVNDPPAVPTAGPMGITIGPAFVAVSNGQFAAKTIELGTLPYGDGGILTISGGSVTVSDGITLGICTNQSYGIGYVVMGGGQLTVTNVTGSGFIDIQNGELLISNGVVQVDKLVMTNSCGQLIHVGGTLVVGKFILGPNAPRITSLVRQGNDLNISWILGPGQTNALQAASGTADGSYSTNAFTDIFVVTNTVTAGSVTNYVDTGATTHSRSRYYRVRWAP